MRGVVPHLKPGAEVAGYRIEAIDREGAGESVLRAHDPVAGRTVALHVSAEPAGAVSTVRFLELANRLQHVEHPHVLPVYDAVTVDGRALAIAKAPPGCRLDTLLPLAPEPATRIARQLASAVEALERAGAEVPSLTPERVWVSVDHAYLDALEGRRTVARPASSSAAVAGLLDELMPRGTAPPPLREVVSRALDGAYFSVGQLADALRGFETSTAARARRRRAIALAVAVLATLLLVAILLVAYL
jgi:hypothetical protein